MNTVSLSFGDRLKQLRMERNLSLEEMGQLLGTTKQVLSRYENGLRDPKISTARLFAERLGVNLRDLFGEEGDRAPPARAKPPQKLWVVSSNGNKKVYNIDPTVAEWVCDLLDHPDKLDRMLERSERS